LGYCCHRHHECGYKTRGYKIFFDTQIRHKVVASTLFSLIARSYRKFDIRNTGPLAASQPVSFSLPQVSALGILPLDLAPGSLLTCAKH
jgi:hypothetical protein